MTGHGTLVIVSIYLPPSKSLLRSDLEALLALGDSVILFGDFNSKNRKWGCEIPNTNGTNLYKLSKELKFEIIASLTPTHYPDTLTSRPSTLDLAITKGVSLYLHCIEALHCLDSDQRPFILRMGPPAGGLPKPMSKVTDWKRVSTALEEIDTPALNNIPDVVQTPDEIDSSIGALTNHIQKWSRGYLPTPPLKKADSSLAIDDVEKAECLADSLELQCSHTIPPVDIHHITRVEEEVRHKTSLEPRNDLSPVSLDEIQKLFKNLNAKMASGLDGMSNKAIKCFPITLLSLLVAIFNACLKNCYFPPVWKEAVVIGIHKPGKPRDLPASYRPISLLSGLGKIYEKILKSRLSEYLFSKGLIINEQFGFRPHHSCPQQALRLVEYITEGFKTKKRTVASFLM
ncbi:Probable RNA-directed DNA polymerase from transposon BS [Eumeta japonica]|uniref:Probable RNA-directed DNA polymerase from transposon BS n=1 Tax=Eumeta variegata TaxID=151549 RepID=A0A4C1USW4_EUMVA|nr:Probable RNA-directed DNA polymerase from transposon BS [Eumeta japonica]